MRALALTMAALMLLGCVRETVACTVLEPGDPLCQDPDADVDADTDAGAEEAGLEAGFDDASADGGIETDL